MSMKLHVLVFHSQPGEKSDIGVLVGEIASAERHPRKEETSPSRECPRCVGLGRVEAIPCARCQGTGKLLTVSTVPDELDGTEISLKSGKTIWVAHPVHKVIDDWAGALSLNEKPLGLGAG